MQTLQITIDESLYDKLLAFIDTLPKDRITMKKLGDEPDFPAISFEEAQARVHKTMEDIKNGKATVYSEDDAFEILEKS